MTPEVDEWAENLAKYMSDCINRKPNGRGGVYRMGMFSIDWIIDAGKQLGASADGRYAGEPVSKNLSASVGMDKKGVTGVINSVTKFDFSNTPNGAVFWICTYTPQQFRVRAENAKKSVRETLLKFTEKE